jgi:hypothetical protein
MRWIVIVCECRRLKLGLLRGHQIQEWCIYKARLENKKKANMTRTPSNRGQPSLLLRLPTR